MDFKLSIANEIISAAECAFGETGLLPVVSGGANYAADLGFVLINEKELPAGYGEGAAQDWTKLR